MRLFVLFTVVVLNFAVLLSSVRAQNNPQDFFPPFFKDAPFADPNRMMESMFGGLSDADLKKIEGVSVSKRDEFEFGEPLVENYLRVLSADGIEVTDEGTDVEYLQKLVALLHPQMKNAKRYEQIKIYLVSAPAPEAKSFPGGTLFFFEGLLEKARNEAALIGVVGHELSHLDRQHQLFPLKRDRLMKRGGLGQNQGFPGFEQAKLYMRPFRPEEESVADLDAANWIYQSGYDPSEFGKLFLRLSAEAPPDQKMAKNFMPSFLRSHPYSEDRQKAVEELAAKLKKRAKKADLIVGIENLKERKPAVNPMRP